MPLVSVIIPTYNRAAMLEEAIQSVLDQNFKDFELIVVDDGSTDKTKDVMKKYTGKIKSVTKVNHGVASARNKGLEMAEGELIAWLDDDDLFLPGKLDQQVRYFREYPRTGLVYTGHVTVNTLQQPVKKSFYVPPIVRDCRSTREALINHCFFANSTVMMKRECFEKTGLFNENLLHTVDYDMWLRTAAYYPFGCVPQVLMVYRFHGRQITMRRDNRILPELRKRARELYGQNPCQEVC